MQVRTSRGCCPTRTASPISEDGLLAPLTAGRTSAGLMDEACPTSPCWPLVPGSWTHSHVSCTPNCSQTSSSHDVIYSGPVQDLYPTAPEVQSIPPSLPVGHTPSSQEHAKGPVPPSHIPRHTSCVSQILTPGSPASLQLTCF